MRILVAEDDRALADLLVELLADEGHRAEAVRTPDRALARAREERWELFLVDSFRETHEGPTEAFGAFVRELAARAPVVVYTGHSWASRVEAAEVGAAAILAKPLEIDELCRTVAAVGRSAGRPIPTRGTA